MAGGLLAGLSTKALGASKIAGASKVAAGSKIGIMPKTFGGYLTRRDIVSSLTGGSGDGGRGVSASNFASSSLRSRISNIGGSVDTSGGLGDMLTSESIMGRRTGQDTTQDFLDTFGSDKTGKVIRSSLMVLRDTFVETFETARILRTALNQTDGLGGLGGKGGDKKKKGGGLLGMLGGLLTSPLGMIGAGIGGGILAKKFGGLKGIKGLLGGAKNTSKVAPKALKPAKEAFGLLPAAGQTGGSIVSKVDDAAKVVGKSDDVVKAVGKSDDAAKAGLNLGKNFNNIKKSVGQGLKGAKNVGGDLLQKGSKFAKNPKKALGALAIGGLGFLGVKALAGGGGNKEQDVVTKLDSVLDKWSVSIDNEIKDSGEGKNVISTSGNATLERGKVTSGSMSQADAEKKLKTLELRKALNETRKSHGRNSPEYNEIRKKLMMLSGTPEEAIYTDKKGNLRAKGYSTYGGKTTVSNKKGGGFGLKRMIGGAADISTMGMFDFDKRSGGGGLRKTANAIGSGIKRGVGGALDFATLGMFDFDKRNRKGAPKGFGLKRILGGVADAITMGTTDFDKRGAGIGQYSGFTGRRSRRKPTTRKSISSTSNVNAHFDPQSGKGYINGREVSMDEYVTFHNLSLKEKVQKYGTKVTSTPQNTSVPQNPKKTPKVMNVSSSSSSGADNNSTAGGGTVSPPSSSGAGSNIAFPPSHNGVSYAAVETQSQMNLVMAD